MSITRSIKKSKITILIVIQLPKLLNLMSITRSIKLLIIKSCWPVL